MTLDFLTPQTSRLLRRPGGPLALVLAGVGVAVACAQAENEPYGIGAPQPSTASTDGMGGASADSSLSSASADTTGGPTSALSSSSDTVASSSDTTGGTDSGTTGSMSSSLTSAISAVTVNSASATDNTSTTGGTTTGDTGTTSTDTSTTGATSTTGGTDNCPDDPDKTEPGVCGCGTPDTNADCQALASNLMHRYSFDGTGTTVTDSVGNADGTASGADQSGGSIPLDGTGTVSLPSGTLSSLGTVTIEAWVTWNGGDAWQRVFDFGDNDGTDGLTYLFLTPQAESSDSGFIRAAFSTSGPGGETLVNGTAAMPGGTITHVAVTVSGSLLELIVDGGSVNTETFTDAVSSIDDTTNLIGGSQFSADPGFQGTIHEFRIYSPAVTADNLSTSYDMGPDVPLQ